MLADISRDGFYTIRIPSYASNVKRDIELDFTVNGGKLSLIPRAGDSFGMRIGDKLEAGSLAELKRDEEDILICVSDCQNAKSFFNIGGKETVSVGCSAKHSIVYSLESKISLSQEPYINIICGESQTYVEKISRMNILYVNGAAAKDRVLLKFGDEIEIMGLEIVYLGSILAVNNPGGNNPGGMIQTNLPLAGNAVGDGVPCSAGTALVRSGLCKASQKREEISFNRIARIYNQIKKENYRIEAPAQSNLREKLPAALTVGPTVTMGITTAASLAMNIIGGNNNIAGFVMSGAMVLGMLLWPNLTKRYQIKQEKIGEAHRQSGYREYLKFIDGTIRANAEENLRIIGSSNPSPSEIADWLNNSTFRRIWERSGDDTDFLNIRIGMGQMTNPSKIEAPKPNYQNAGDPLLTEAGEIESRFKYLDNTPVVINLKTGNSVGIIGLDSLVRNMTANAVLQLAALHSASEMKLVFIYDEINGNDFNWVKKLPHTWSGDMDYRYITHSKAEVQQLFRRLLEELESRTASRGNEPPAPAYVMFIINKALIEDVSVERFISSEYKASGFASVYAFGDMESIPNGCKTIIQVTPERSAYYDRMEAGSGFRQFEKETVNFKSVHAFASQMSLINSGSAAKNTAIPSNVSFMDLFRVGSVEEIDILKRWAESTPQKSLSVPIGIRSGGELFFLDIHEKAHGSHGLMAGTTGSGKSEAIQAIILSLAVHFHPDDVCFVLIDFKGGGMANLFTGMPHIAGTITNLGNSIRRSMISLNAEIKNRQTMLKNAGVNHIDKYQKLYHEGKADTPMPHMVLISDEFAELKAQQPEFMAELISVARIGRSLGVHLILATQKPTGVVDDQIWSNTRFRICLKVADKGDSMGMIESPLAAAITLPGRGYIQVGYNEVFEQFQSAYTGADYIPVESYIDLETQQVIQLDSCGQQTGSAAIAPKAKTNSGKEKINQLEAVVHYIADVADKNKIPQRLIWTEPVPHFVTLSEAEKMFAPPEDVTERRAPVGILDDPEKQTLRPLVVSLDNGHIAVYGSPGCGKTTFVQTLLYSLIKRYTTLQVKFEIIDFGNRTLEVFKNAAHTNSVLTPSDSDDMVAVLQELLDEIELRKEKFALKRQESLRKYISATKEELPVILLAVDGYQKLSEELPDIRDVITEIIKYGAKYGVIVLLTTNAVSAISYKHADYFTEKYALQLSDSIDYATVVGATHGMLPETVKGRGLYKYDGRILEYQTALCIGETDDGTRSNMIIEELTKKYGNKNNAEKPRPETPPSSPKRSGGAVGNVGINAFSSTGTPSRRSKKKLTFYSAENGIAVAKNRASNEDIHLPYGAGMYILLCGTSGFNPAGTIADEAVKKGRKVYYCGADSVPEGISGIVSEAEINVMVSAAKEEGSGAVIIIEDLMKFYQAISDADLEIFVGILKGEVKPALIAVATIQDAKILRDYPFGILLFKMWKNGMIISGKAIDGISVLHQELIDTMSYDERNMLTSEKSAVLFQQDGAFERVFPLG